MARYVQVLVRMPADLHAELKAEAAKLAPPGEPSVSMAEAVRRILRRWLDERRRGGLGDLGGV